VIEIETLWKNTIPHTLNVDTVKFTVSFTSLKNAL